MDPSRDQSSNRTFFGEKSVRMRSGSRRGSLTSEL
jgi:hypothetical protein